MASPHLHADSASEQGKSVRHRLYFTFWKAAACLIPDHVAQDKTFTCTLFAPTAEFDRLNTPETIIQFFKTHFPDALPLIGEDALLDDFKRNPRSSLMSIKVCLPICYANRCIRS